MTRIWLMAKYFLPRKEAAKDPSGVKVENNNTAKKAFFLDKVEAAKVLSRMISGSLCMATAKYKEGSVASVL